MSPGRTSTSRPPAVAAIAALSLLLATPACRDGDAGDPPIDEAAAAGRDADSFPAADDDWFRAMDGGVALTPSEVRGRNSWMVWTGGNEAMWDHLANNSFGAFDLLKTLSSHPALPVERSNRFARLGLWNEPGFEQATAPDPERYGLWLDRRGAWRDPFEDPERYPGLVAGSSFYGEPSGIVGLRLFPNPAFDEAAAARWDAERFYTDPGYYLDRELIRPYRVGMSCAFCHVSADPLRPPTDPESPRWEELSAYVGAQYFRNGRIFFYDPDPANFVFQLFDAPPPGTSDTSLIATDNIFNPRNMNAIYEVGPRMAAAQRWGAETLAGGALANRQLPDLELADGTVVESFEPPDRARVPRVLKDGADSVGILAALNRVYVNIGTFHQEWFRHFEPLIGGRPQTPFDVAQARERSSYWRATEARTPDVAAYFLAAARPHRLADAPGGAAYLDADAATLERGRRVFAAECALCHSSKQPSPPAGIDPFSSEHRAWLSSPEGAAAMVAVVSADDFLDGNYLSTDRRIPVDRLGTNLCSPLASNAVAGGIWEAFSSDTYRRLPVVGAVEVADPFDAGLARPFEMPGGGRGYTRVPSLVSVWSSAPYLLNNSLGPHEADPSVAARMRSFERSIELLLWPELREPYVARTTAVSWLKVGVAYLRSPLDQLVGFFSRWFGNGVIEIGPIPAGTPVALLANLALNDPERHAEIIRLLPDVGRVLAEIAVRDLDERQAAERLREEVAPRLLELSSCPDFVMNRGHTFGSDLTDADKRALIELLKTF